MYNNGCICEQVLVNLIFLYICCNLKLNDVCTIMDNNCLISAFYVCDSVQFSRIGGTS